MLGHLNAKKPTNCGKLLKDLANPNVWEGENMLQCLNLLDQTGTIIAKHGFMA